MSNQLMATSILRTVPREVLGGPPLHMMLVLIYFWPLLGRRALTTFDNPVAICLWGNGTKS